MWTRRTYAPVLFLSTSTDGVTFTDGTPLLAVCTHFKYKRDLKKGAETTFTFWNYNKLLDDPRFFANAVWRFRYGYFGDISAILTGTVRELDPDYKDKRTVQVKLLDHTLNMAVSSSSRNWGKIPSSDVAKAIARKYNFEIYVDPSNDAPKKAWIQPGDVGDLQYLRDLAASIDFEMFVVDSPPRLYYRKKPYNTAPVGTLTYYSDQSEFAWVKSFKPKLKHHASGKSGAASAEKSASTDQGDKSNQALAPYVVQVTGDQGSASVVPGTQNGITKPVPSGSNVTQLAHASRQTLLDKVNECVSEHPMTASLIPGSTWIWAGEIDKALAGKWYLQGVDIELSGSTSSTKCDWKRNSQNTKNNDPSKNANSQGAPAVQVSGDSGNATVNTRQF